MSGPAFRPLTRAQRRTKDLEPGVSKVHYISARIPMLWRRGVRASLVTMRHALSKWRELLEMKVTLKRKERRLESFLEPDYANDAWILTVGIPEGVNASDFYCTHLKPWEEAALR